MSFANTILRWVLALFGAAVALGVGFVVPVIFWAIIFGREANIRSTSSGAVALALAVMCSTIVWAWAGSSIAPARHRRISLAVFSVPVVLLALLFLLALVFGQVERRNVPAGIAVLLACVAIAAIAVHRRHSTLAVERRRTIEQIAEVFSDEPDRKVKAQK